MGQDTKVGHGAGHECVPREKTCVQKSIMYSCGSSVKAWGLRLLREESHMYTHDYSCDSIY